MTNPTATLILVVGTNVSQLSLPPNVAITVYTNHNDKIPAFHYSPYVPRFYANVTTNTYYRINYSNVAMCHELTNVLSTGVQPDKSQGWRGTNESFHLQGWNLSFTYDQCEPCSPPVVKWQTNWIADRFFDGNMVRSYIVTSNGVWVDEFHKAYRALGNFWYPAP